MTLVVTVINYYKMAISSTYYLNGLSLSSSTTIYSDSALTTIAPDGFYADGIISREQVSGVLLPAVTCGNCTTSCGQSINTSGVTGIYLLNLDTGTTASDIGAVVIKFNPIGIPDGIRVNYNGNVYNKLSSPVDGVHQSTDPTAFTVIGSTGSDCGLQGNTTNLPTIAEYLYSGGSFSATGNTQDITINPGDVSLGSVPGICVIVIPKLNSTPSLFNVEIIGPCSNTAWNINVDCPVLLPSFSSTNLRNNENIPCSEPFTNVYYFAKVHTDADFYVGLYDFVFEDPYGATPLIDGYYMTNDVQVPNKVLHVVDGVVVAITNCTGTPAITYNSVVEVNDCTTASGIATTIVEEGDITVGTQLISTSGGNLTNLPIGFYRLSNNLNDGQVYTLNSILATNYIIQVDNNGQISQITQC